MKALRGQSLERMSRLSTNVDGEIKIIIIFFLSEKLLAERGPAIHIFVWS